MRITTPYADLLPPRSSEEMEALRADIQAQGVLDCCKATQDGRLLDGHARRSIDPNAPIVLIPGSHDWSDEECHAYIFRHNNARRNLSPDQRREMRESMRKTALALRQKDPKKYTQEVLAQMLGVDQSTIARWTDDVSIMQLHNANIIPDGRLVISKEMREEIISRSEAGESRRSTPAFPA